MGDSHVDGERWFRSSDASIVDTCIRGEACRARCCSYGDVNGRGDVCDDDVMSGAPLDASREGTGDGGEPCGDVLLFASGLRAPFLAELRSCAGLF
jgi:hypothetical protein